MRALLDVNVLVALLDDKHTKNLAALEWLESARAEGWASCPLTENGCLRIVTNPRYPNSKTVGELLAKLDEIQRQTLHAFWPDNLSITDWAIFDPTGLRGHQQITDIYLLALAGLRTAGSW